MCEIRDTLEKMQNVHYSNAFLLLLFSVEIKAHRQEIGSKCAETRFQFLTEWNSNSLDNDFEIDWNWPD